MTDIVAGFRKVVQDLLVPELKAIQVEIKHQGEKISELQQEMKELRKEMNERFEAMHKEMNERFEAVHKEIMELKIGQKEILAKLDVDRRLSRLEAFVEEIRKQKVAS